MFAFWKSRDRSILRRAVSYTLAAIIAVVAFADMAVAQSNALFSPVPSSTSAALQVPGGALSTLQARPTTSSVQLVRANIDALQNETIVIDLPVVGALRADRSKVNSRSPSDYTWFGDVAATGGTAVLVVQNGEITGRVEAGKDHFFIKPLGDGVHAIIKVDQNKFPPDHPHPVFPRGDKSGQATAPSQPAGTTADPIVVDVLVAYTTASRVAYGGNMAAFAQLAVDTSNTAYNASNAGMNLRLAGSMEISYSESGKTFDTVLDDLLAGTNAQMASVHTQRDALGADMVALLINLTDFCGLAADIASSATNAYATVYWDCSVSNYSFPHELGHLVGARHDPYVDPTTTPYAYGHGYTHPYDWRTIMAYNNDCADHASGCPRLGYFSNPSNLYNGVPMGTTSTHDNARVHRERVATVAAFRSAPTPSSLSVSPSTNIAASGTQGGSFSPSSFQYQLSASSGSVNYSITGVPSWLNISSSSGTVTTSATTITFTVNSTANSLSPGTYGPTTITFTNTTNGSGNTTRTATLTVNAPATPPANDNFANAATINLGQTKTANSANATRQSGEPLITGNNGGKSVWWNYLAAQSGPILIRTAGSSFDTVLGVYTGSAVNALTLVASNDDVNYPTDSTSQVTFNAVAGTTYRIAVDGYNGGSGAASGNVSLGVFDNATPGAASIVSAVAPISRATTVNQNVTAYASIVNASSTTTATSCSIALPGGVPATFTYQTTNSSGTPTGSPNTPVNIAPNGTQGFFFVIKPTQTMSQEIALIFDCSNTNPAPVFPGINTFSLTAGSSVADMLIATATAPTFGIMDIANRSSASSFTATALNIGPSATLTFVPTDTAIGQLPAGQPLALLICQINPSNAQCINPVTPGASSTVTLNTNQAAYFGVYVIAQGTYIPLDIANNRVYIQAKQSGTPLAQGSVAVRMLSSADLAVADPVSGSGPVASR